MKENIGNISNTLIEKPEDKGMTVPENVSVEQVSMEAREIWKKIKLAKIRSPFTRMVLLLLIRGMSLEDICNIKTATVIAQNEPWVIELASEIAKYIAKDGGRIGEYFFSEHAGNGTTTKKAPSVLFDNLYLTVAKQHVTKKELRVISKYFDTSKDAAFRANVNAINLLEKLKKVNTKEANEVIDEANRIKELLNNKEDEKE